MSKLEKWLEKNKPLKKKSNLYEFESDILKMIELNYTQNQIRECLKDVHGIETTQQNLSVFIKKQKKAEHKIEVKREVAKPQISTDLSEEEQEKAKTNAELNKAFAKFLK